MREAAKVFRTLGRLGDGGGRVPEWQSTHPDPGNRVERAEQRVAQLPAGALKNATVNRDTYLRLLNGMVFGENPRQGYFRGPRFLHPDLRFELTFPTGWKTANLPDAVVAGSPDNSAQIQLVPGQGTPSQALQGFLGQQGIVVNRSGQTTINGIPAVIASFTAQTESGAISGIAMSLSHQNTTYLLLGIMAQQVASQRGAEVESSIRSFRALNDPALINVQPARVEIVTLPSAMTAAQFLARYPSTVPEAQVLIINGIEASSTLPRGALMKRVVGGIGS